VRHYLAVIAWSLLGIVILVLLLGWCSGFAEMEYDQRFGDEKEVDTYCWDYGDPHPHRLAHKVPLDHYCTADDLADAARRRFNRSADVTPYFNDLTPTEVSNLVDLSLRRYQKGLSCNVLQVRGSTALVDCGSVGNWYVTRQRNAFYADTVAKSQHK
jgi:hypothetical protein